MDNSTFQGVTEKAFSRCINVLNKKEKEYSEGVDRLDQFKRVASMNNEIPTISLWGMASKHVTSIASMTKFPTSYNLEIWKEKLTDLHNYLFLLEALLVDLETK